MLEFLLMTESLLMPSTQVQLPDVPRVPFFLLAVALVSIAILDTVIVMRLFQARMHHILMRSCAFLLIGFFPEREDIATVACNAFKDPRHHFGDTQFYAILASSNRL